MNELDAVEGCDLGGMGGMGNVISLKKYLDMVVEELEPAPSNPLEASVESYRRTLRCMGESAGRACPPVGTDLQQGLLQLANKLGKEASPELLLETGNQASHQLEQWSGRAVEYFGARTAEIKDLLIVLARTTESVGKRDRQYTDHFKRFTTQLRTISNFQDLTQIRASLVEQAAELKTYVDQMENDGSQLVKTLQAQVTSYESKLKEVEDLAWRDALTNLANRRSLEQRIESRIAQGATFCVAMLDLNGLKLVNDQHGHLAGDSLLQQFGDELRSNSRSSDLVGRWGGDEFLIVIECDLNGASTQVERVKKWVFGEYTLCAGSGSAEVRVQIDAAVGVAQWQSGEGIKHLIERADALMYAQKGRRGRSKAAAAPSGDGK
jgi:diguanylate cyclase (GGDEF)-like protein